MNVVSRVDTVSAAIAEWQPGAGHFLDIDTATFRTHFNRQPFLFRHHICDHPLFALPRLVALAKSLRENLVEYNSGTIPVSLPDWENTPYTGLSAEETIERTAECCSWMVLKRAEHDPEFRHLIARVIDEIEPLSQPIEPGMCEREAAVFVSSPGSITPYHMDHEINFLLQIRGSKTVSVFSASDRTVLTERQLESHFAGPAIHRNMPFRDEWQERATVFELQPGDGVHIPTTDPHWVKNGDSPSVSLSASFKTAASLRRGRIYHMNATLRGLGLDPAPYGRFAVRDEVKHHALRALRRTQRWFDREPATG